MPRSRSYVKDHQVKVTGAKSVHACPVRERCARDCTNQKPTVNKKAIEQDEDEEWNILTVYAAVCNNLQLLKYTHKIEQSGSPWCGVLMADDALSCSTLQNQKLTKN